MGWCSATSIIDTAIKAAESLFDAVGTCLHCGARVACCEPEGHEAVQASARDDVLRPFVRAIADELRDGDWDCQEDSAYFERFPQEMLSHDDPEHADWLSEQIAAYSDDPDRVIALAGQLRAVQNRMKADAR